ncbi:MAG: N-acetylglucosamine-6-phosphate deacetylase [Armatimonadota bacterium]|nr:N-acetylglucosamine-6-phosphate deacetylase [Armatimonadota bacterium]
MSGHAPRARRADLVLQAGAVLLPEGVARPGFVTVEDGVITRVAQGTHPNPDEAWPDGVLAPGFIDLQINGAAGCDFLAPDPDGLAAAEAHMLRGGTTAYLATLISAPEPALRAALGFFAERAARGGAPRLAGVHLEGPFLSPLRPGAHSPEHLRPPSVAWISGLLDEFPGLVRMVTLAPELVGALPVIEALRARGVVVAAGHTDATYAQAVAAFDEGVRVATHLFNAMRPAHHREPGIALAALGRPEVVCTVIADGVHLHPAVLDLVIAVKGPRGAALITDAISAAGAPADTATLGDRTVRLADGAPRLADGTLAGSVLTMDEAVRRLVAGRAGLPGAVTMAAATPARVLGLDAGEIRVGRLADLVALDRALVPAATVVAGAVAWRRAGVGPGDPEQSGVPRAAPSSG